MHVYSYRVDPQGGPVTIQLRCQNANYVSTDWLRRLTQKSPIKPKNGTKTDWDVPSSPDVYTVESAADVNDGQAPGTVTYGLTVRQNGKIIRADGATSNTVKDVALPHPDPKAGSLVYYMEQIVIYN